MGDSSSGGAIAGLLRALGTVLGLHIQYAQREAKDDVGRLIGGVVVIVVGAVFALFGVLLGHAALIVYLEAYTRLGWLQAVGVVAGGDLLLAILLIVVGRSRLRKPLLKQTRSLVRRTVSAFADLREDTP